MKEGRKAVEGVQGANSRSRGRQPDPEAGVKLEPEEARRVIEEWAADSPGVAVDDDRVARLGQSEGRSDGVGA